MNWSLALLFWIHLLGIAIWLGGSILLPLVILPAMQALEPPARTRFVQAFAARFTPWVIASIVAVVVTGILQTGQLYGFAYLMGINLLVIKIIVAVLMIANGFYVGVVLSRKAVALAPAAGAPASPEFLKTLRLLGMHAWIQAGMSVIILLLVGMITA